MRVQIALDAARGLEYIHEHTKTHYVHRDIKSSNILLDGSFRAKVLTHSILLVLLCDLSMLEHVSPTLILFLIRFQILGCQSLLEKQMMKKQQQQKLLVHLVIWHQSK